MTPPCILAASIAVVAAASACKFEPGALGTREDARLDSLTDSITDVSSIDAAADAPPAQCAASYDLTNAAEPASRYRLVTTQSAWLAAEMDCEDDGGGGPAHLIVLDDAAERLWAYEQGNTDKWVGVTDLVAEGVPIAVTLQTLPYTGTAASNDQPKDCMFNNQNVTVMESCANAAFPYLCECDGLAASPARYGE